MNQDEYALYDQMEKNHWWFKGRRAILRAFLDRIPDRDQKSVLEVGCGPGGNLLYLFDEFKTREGAEANPEAVTYAQRKCGSAATVRQFDANRLAELEQRYDCVAFLDVLYHQAIPDVDHVLASAAKILRPGGYLLISDGAFNFLQGAHSRQVHSARRFTRSELRKRIYNQGFGIVRASYWGMLPFLILALKRLVIEKLKPSSPPSSDVVEMNPVINAALLAELEVESFVIRGCSLPFGSSVAVLARKPSALEA